ncbi:hypothetical protein MMC21_000383 [Puttea exsequens]|nr:hypothetical protein [Puttea exsequens]
MVQRPPLNTAYVNFYSAVSNEAIACATHELSNVKLDFLKTAKSSYEGAAATLPAPDPSFDTNVIEDDAISYSSYLSKDSDESEILDYYESSPSRPTSLEFEPATSPSSIESCDLSPTPKNPMLSSRQMHHRALSETPTASGVSPRPFSLTASLDSFPTPPKHLPSSPAPTTSLERLQSNHEQHAIAQSLTIIPSQLTWLQIFAYHRYNASLAAFAEMLQNHIRTVDSLIQRTQEAQAKRYGVKKMLSFYGDEEAKRTDVKAKIVRLKAQGWKRVRFDGARYQELCAVALSEL